MKEKKKHRRTSACDRKWHIVHGIISASCKAVIKFGNVWKRLVMVRSTGQNDIQTEKKKCSRTHSPVFCLTMTKGFFLNINTPPQKAISIHHERRSYDKYSCYVLKSVCFVVLLRGCFFFRKTLLQLSVMEHMCPLSGANIFYRWPLKRHWLHGIIGL